MLTSGRSSVKLRRARQTERPLSTVSLLLTTLGWRGSAASFLKIAHGLKRHGHQVRVLTASSAMRDGFGVQGIDAVALDLPDSGLGSAKRLRQALRASGSDILIADAPRDVRLGALATIGRATALVWRFNLPNRPVPGDLLARLLFGRLDRIICQSEWSAGLLATGAPWLSGVPVHRIANGYDIDALAPAADRGAAFRAAHGLPLDLPLVLTVGALSPEKGVPAAITAVAALSCRGVEVVHLLIGDGQDEAALRQSAPPHLRFLGALDERATADAMRAADVVLLPAPREIFPNVVAEAMALGRAVVTVRGGAAPEVAGDAAVLVEPGDVAAMAGAVESLLADPARRSALGVAGRERIGAEFPLARMEDAYAALVSTATPCRSTLRASTLPDR